MAPERLRRAGRPSPPPDLFVYELGEHAMRVDRDEQAFTSRQYLAFLIQNLRRVDVLATTHAQLAGFHSQGFVQRDGLQVVHRDLRRERDYLTELVNFPHRFVEKRGDDSAVAVAGRAGEAFA